MHGILSREKISYALLVLSQISLAMQHEEIKEDHVAERFKIKRQFNQLSDCCSVMCLEPPQLQWEHRAHRKRLAMVFP